MISHSFAHFLPTQWALKCDYKATINPMAVKFIPEQALLANPGEFYEIDDPAEAQRKSPLAVKIFEESKKNGDIVDFITLTNKFVTITLKNGL